MAAGPAAVMGLWPGDAGRTDTPTASSPRSPPAPTQQGTDLATVLLHLEAQHRKNALQRMEERLREQRERDEDRRADRQAAEERAAQTEAQHLPGLNLQH
jgi:hypothetical protein